MFNFFLGYIDLPVNIFINNHHFPYLESLAAIISFIADVKILITVAVIIGLYFFFSKKWQETAIIILSVGSTAVAVTLMKHIFMRIRPDNALQTIVGDPSFPSGHASMSAAFFIALMAVFLPKIHSASGRIWFIAISSIAIIAIGFSRLILSVHWATDVIFGWSIGIVLALISIYIAKRIKG